MRRDGEDAGEKGEQDSFPREWDSRSRKEIKQKQEGEYLLH